MPDLSTKEVIARARQNHWKVGVPTAAVTIALLVGGSTLGNVHGDSRQHIVVWSAAVGFLIFGVVAVRRLAAGVGDLIGTRTMASAGVATRLGATGLGYLFLLFAVLGLLDVSIEHLLVGAGLAGIVLGIAATQSLGNVFAAVVLLFAKPFVVGDHIRIRSGAMGGVFDAVVLNISLTYVTLHTDEGVLKIPNSVMIATAVGPYTPSPPGGRPEPVAPAPVAAVPEPPTAPTAPLEPSPPGPPAPGAPPI